MQHEDAPVVEVGLEAESVQFGSAGETIRGTLHLPSGAEGPVAGVVLGHGWGMVAGGDLETYAKRIAARGLAALTFDFRRLGRSDGEPRQEIDPAWQIEDYRTAITYLASRPEVDADRLGIWGSSYSGGHVLVVAATDNRVRCVVAQVPTISGYESGLRKTHPENLAALRARFHADRAARLAGEPPAMVQSVGTADEPDVAYPGSDSYDYMMGESTRTRTWRNETTLRSLEAARAYEPGTWITRISPAPLLMIVADHDLQTPTDLQLDAYSRAHEPKELVIVRGGHYSVYLEHFEQTSTAAAAWFSQHL